MTFPRAGSARRIPSSIGGSPRLATPRSVSPDPAAPPRRATPVAPPPVRNRGTVLAAVLLLPAILYLATLYPGVGGRINPGDSVKFQYIGEVLGVPHQPGYPQYVVLNWLWTRLPLPLDLARKVNLLSAVCALVAGGFLFAFFGDLARSRRAAALATWTVLLAPTVWSFATEAEVYALNLAWLAAVAWAANRWRRQPSAGRLAALLLIYALSFGNHPLMITALPGLLVLLFATAGRRLLRPGVVAAAVLAALLGLSQYGFLLWRSHSDAPVVEGIKRQAGLAELARSLSGQRFTDQHLMGKGGGELARRLARMPVEAALQLTPVALLLGLAGLWVLARPDPAMAGFLALGALTPAVFAAVYQIGDWESYLAPAWAMLAAAAAVAAAVALRQRPRAGRPLLILWAAVLVGLTAVRLPAMRLAESPWQRDLLFRAAPAGSRVVAYRGPSYLATQLNRYYALGLGLAERRGLEIVTAAQTFEDQLLFLDDRPTVFRQPDIRALFDRYRVDYVKRWFGDGEDEFIYFTGTVYPVDGLRLTPAPSADTALAGVAVSTTDGRPLVAGGSGVQLIVVSPIERRIKGVFEFSLDDPDDALQRLGATLLQVPDHDWLCLLVQDPALRTRRQLVGLVAGWMGLRPNERRQALTARQVVAMGGRPAQRRPGRWLRVDPRPEVIAVPKVR